jgi:hypothetical protein
MLWTDGLGRDMPETHFGTAVSSNKRTTPAPTPSRIDFARAHGHNPSLVLCKKLGQVMYGVMRGEDDNRQQQQQQQFSYAEMLLAGLGYADLHLGPARARGLGARTVPHARLATANFLASPTWQRSPHAKPGAGFASDVPGAGFVQSDQEGDSVAVNDTDFPPPLTVRIDFGWGNVFEAAVHTELALAAALIYAPQGVGVLAHDCEGHVVMQWEAGEAGVGDQYAPQYAIAKDALSVLWTDMAVALYHKFAAV